MSLVLPLGHRESFGKEADKSDTVVSIENQPGKVTKDVSVLCWFIYQIIRLLCWAFCATLVAIFAFTWIFYAIDVYWSAHVASNDSMWVWENQTITSLSDEATTIDYEDQY